MKHNGAPACTLTTPNGFSKLFGGSDFVLRREHRYFKGDKPTIRSALPDPCFDVRRQLHGRHECASECGSHAYVRAADYSAGTSAYPWSR